MVREKTARIEYFPAILFFGAIGGALASVIILQKSSWRYYLYAFFPVYFWQEVFVRKDALIKGSRILFAHVKTPAAYANVAIKTVGYIAALEAIVSKTYE